MLSKIVVLGLIAAAAAALGWGVHRLLGSLPASLAAVAVLLAAALAALLVFVAWAFKRFDVGADVPG